MKKIIYIILLCLFSNSVFSQEDNKFQILLPVLDLLLSDTNSSQDTPDGQTATPIVSCPNVSDGVSLNLAGVSLNDSPLNLPNDILIIDTQAKLNSLQEVTRIDGSIILLIGSGITLPIDMLGSDTDFSPLDSLVEITGGIALQTHDDNTIEKLDIFSCLKEVGGNLDLGERLITPFTNFIEISGFENLTHVGGRLELSAHTDLKVAPSFNNLQSIGDGLFIFATPLLESLPSFSSLTTINSGVFILSAGTFSEIDGLNQLETINGDGDTDRQSVINNNLNLICNENTVPQILLPATESNGNASNCPEG